MPTRTATCACGAVEIALDGPPIATLSCCCDDCQAAAARLEALPGAPAFREDCGGTPATLYPRRALKVTRGRDKLDPVRLRDGSPTRRMVATCCNAFLYADFDRGPFWVDVVNARFTGDAPRPRWRIQTRFLKDPPPGDIPNHPKYPQGLVWRLALAGVLNGLPGRR
ncbi:MAG: hypothetical protein KDK10_05740 [Maritimibacter sp.]|nr:hypothetical protein [Maritimibacter sp.]